MIDIILRAVISAWLIVIAIQDIRRGEVSNWLTIPPLLAAVAWRAIQGQWIILLLFGLILFISEWPVAWPLGIAVVVGIWPEIVRQGLEPTMAVWLILSVLWTLDVLGGADVKAAMTLTAVFPDSRLAWLMMLCWWSVSLIVFVRRYGRSAPRVLLATFASFRLCSSQGGHRAPALPSLALAGLVFLWFYSPNLL